MEQKINKDYLDKAIREALLSDKKLWIPDGVTDKIITTLEKKVILRSLVAELVSKILIALASLVILAGVFIWIDGIEALNTLMYYISDYWQYISSLIFIVFFILLVDQVGLRFYFLQKNGKLTYYENVGK